MIKGKSPYPFQTLALAVSFAPGLPFLVAEMRRLCDLHDSNCIFIHVGKRTGEKQREISTLLSEYGFHDGNSKIFWENGEVVSSILNACKQEVADLLIVGASDKDHFSLPVGQNAVNLALRAKCSVLVYSAMEKGPFRKIIVNGIEHEKSELTMLTSIYFAEKEKSVEVVIAEDNEQSNEGGETNTMTKDSFLVREAAAKSNVTIHHTTLASENTNTLSEFAFKTNADLLITFSSDHKLLIFDRIMIENGIESLLKKLPCNLLVVHSRLPD